MKRTTKIACLLALLSAIAFGASTMADSPSFTDKVADDRGSEPNICDEPEWNESLGIDEGSFEHLNNGCHQDRDQEWSKYSWEQGWHCHPKNDSMENCEGSMQYAQSSSMGSSMSQAPRRICGTEGLQDNQWFCNEGQPLGRVEYGCQSNWEPMKSNGRYKCVPTEPE